MALALVAAACGSGTIEDQVETATASSESAESTEPTADASAEEAPASTESADASQDAPADEPEAPADPGPHAFPDLDTVDITTGATVNLAAQLAGGDTPVLLWFFAPH